MMWKDSHREFINTWSPTPSIENPMRVLMRRTASRGHLEPQGYITDRGIEWQDPGPGYGGKEDLQRIFCFAEWTFQKKAEKRHWRSSLSSSWPSPSLSFWCSQGAVSSNNGKPINSLILHILAVKHTIRENLADSSENKVEKKRRDINRLINYWELDRCVNNIL